MVNEYNTTKKCHDCHQYLQVLHEKDMRKDAKDNYEIRGLRRCLSTACHKHRLVLRDLNAAKNILKCYKAGKDNRPDYLCPASGRLDDSAHTASVVVPKAIRSSAI